MDNINRLFTESQPSSKDPQSVMQYQLDSVRIAIAAQKRLHKQSYTDDTLFLSTSESQKDLSGKLALDQTQDLGSSGHLKKKIIKAKSLYTINREQLLMLKGILFDADPEDPADTALYFWRHAHALRNSAVRDEMLELLSGKHESDLGYFVDEEEAEAFNLIVTKLRESLELDSYKPQAELWQNQLWNYMNCELLEALRHYFAADEINLQATSIEQLTAMHRLLKRELAKYAPEACHSEQSEFLLNRLDELKQLVIALDFFFIAGPLKEKASRSAHREFLLNHLDEMKHFVSEDDQDMFVNTANNLIHWLEGYRNLEYDHSLCQQILAATHSKLLHHCKVRVIYS
jgi:hypothetical protein